MPDDCQEGWISHRTQAGETLDGIAAQYGLPTGAVIQARGLLPLVNRADVNLIARSGDICIPNAETYRAMQSQDQDAAQSNEATEEIASLLEQLEQEIAQSEALLNSIDFESLTLLSDVLLKEGEELPELLPESEALEAWLRSEEGGYRPSYYMQNIPFVGLPVYWFPKGDTDEYPSMELPQLLDEWSSDLIETLEALLYTGVPFIPDAALLYPIEESPYLEGQDPEAFWNAAASGHLQDLLGQVDLSPVQMSLLGLDVVEYNALVIQARMGEGPTDFNPIYELGNQFEIASRLGGFIDAAETDRINYILDHWDEESERAQLDALQVQINQMPRGDIFGLPSENVRSAFQGYYDGMMARHQALAALKRFRDANSPETQDRELVMRYLLQARAQIEANRQGRDPRDPAWERMTWEGLNAELEALLRLPENFDLMVAYHRELYGLSPDYHGEDLLGLVVGVSLFLLSLNPVAGRVLAVIGLLRGDVTEIVEFLPFGAVGARLRGLGDGARAVPWRIRSWAVRNADDVMRQWDEALTQWDEALAVAGGYGQHAIPFDEFDNVARFADLGDAARDAGRADDLVAAYERRERIYIHGSGGRGDNLAELDVVRVNEGIIIENKDGRGLSHPRSVQTPEQWAEDQIYEAGRRKIDAIENGVGAYHPDGNVIPRMEDLRGIRHLEFQVLATDSDIMAAVQAQIQRLQDEHSDWIISVQFGVNDN